MIAPPSADDGYWWCNDGMLGSLLKGDVPDMPEILCSRLAPASKSSPNDVGCRARPAERWANNALEKELANARSAAAGSRNDTLNVAAFNLGQIVGGGHLERSLVEDGLLNAALSAGLDEHEGKATIRSGIEDGIKEPRDPKLNALKREDARAMADRPWPELDLSLLDSERDAPPLLAPRVIFGPDWGRWLESAAEAKGAPVDYVAGALISVAGSLVGNARWAHPYGDWKEPPIFWVMLVGNPSARKSPALDAVRSPLQTVADRAQSAVEPFYKKWLEAREVAEVHFMAWRETAKVAAKKGRPFPARPPEADAGEEPHVPKLEVNDATVEGLTKILARQVRGTLVVRDELAGWLGGMNRYNTGSSDRPFWIEAFGGRRFSVDRASKERLSIPRVLVSLVGAIQPEPLGTQLLKPDDDGLVARFCPFWPLLSPAGRPSTRVDMDFAVAAFQRLFDLEMGKDIEGEPCPIFVPFSGAAQVLLDDLVASVSGLEKEAEGEGLLVSFIGKLPGTAVRLALLLSLLDWAALGKFSPPKEVSGDCMERAITFATGYILPMARRTYSAAAGNPSERSARRLLRLILREDLRELTARDVYRRKLSGLKGPNDVKQALRVLEDAGIVRPEHRATGGRVQQLFVSNPLLWRLGSEHEPSTVHRGDR